MNLRRKPDQKTNETVDNFISQAPGQTTTDLKSKQRTISISLLDSDMVWINSKVKELNGKTARKITRTEFFSVAIDLIKKKSTDEILHIIQTR